MAKQMLVPVLALGLLVGGAGMLLVRDRDADPPEEDSASAGGVDLDAAASIPSLMGRLVEALPGETPRVDEVTVPIDEPLGGATAEILQARMLVLVEEIRRNVAPDWWSRGHGEATLEAHGSTVIARAPHAVLDAVETYLRGRRTSTLEGEEAEPLDGQLLEAAMEDVRNVLRGVLSREQSLVRALRAWEEGDLDAVRRQASAVLAVEPDNQYAQRMLQALDGATASGELGGEAVEAPTRLRAQIDGARRERVIDAWALRWPSVATWKALAAAREEALKRGGAGRAADFDTVLEQGSLRLAVEDESLLDVVRRLQIESSVAVHLPASLLAEADELRIRNVDEPSRSLRFLLDELLRKLPAGWGWRSDQEQIVISRIDLDGGVVLPTQLRYFDVRDLVAFDAPAATSPRRAEPPVPRVYTPEEIGGE